MTAASTFLDSLDDPAAPPPSEPPRRRTGDAALYLALALLSTAVWQLSRAGLYSAGSDLGYGMGVAGGVMMLALFAYPLRKRWPALARLGKTKHWFIVHMVLGIGGPLMVLAHSTLRVGSLNAGVALFSMLLVAASGVAGRFIYLRIHQGLGGERLSLDALRRRLGFEAQDQRSRLHFAPGVEQRLRAFEGAAVRSDCRWSTHAARLAWLPWRARLVRRACAMDTDRALQVLARERGWSQRELRTRQRQARQLAQRFVQSVLRVAQFSSYVRLFSLWHVLHIPFVYVMVLCAVVHVVAVHAY